MPSPNLHDTNAPPPSHPRRRDLTPSGVEMFSRGEIVPVQWAHERDERDALRAANGANLEAERMATIAVLVAFGLLVLLGLVRLFVS